MEFSEIAYGILRDIHVIQNNASAAAAALKVERDASARGERDFADRSISKIKTRSDSSWLLRAGTERPTLTLKRAAEQFSSKEDGDGAAAAAWKIKR